MADSLWDARIYNDGQIAEKCMTLGAVILKPAGKLPVGFSPPKTESSANADIRGRMPVEGVIKGS